LQNPERAEGKRLGTSSAETRSGESPKKRTERGGTARKLFQAPSRSARNGKERTSKRKAGRKGQKPGQEKVNQDMGDPSKTPSPKGDMGGKKGYAIGTMKASGRSRRSCSITTRRGIGALIFSMERRNTTED